jgi:hypothetical protein
VRWATRINEKTYLTHVKLCNTRIDPGVDLGEQVVSSLVDVLPQAV